MNAIKLFTKETILGNINIENDGIKGIITSEEAFRRSNQTKNLIVYTSDRDKIFFFSDSTKICQAMLPPHISINIMHFPRYGLVSPDVRNGFINTIKKFIIVFFYDYHQLKTMHELLQYLNEF